MESALCACLLAVHFGATVGLSEAELSHLYYLVLLWFAGCTADNHIAAAIFGDAELGARERKRLDVDFV